MSESEDDELMERVRRGERAAFEELTSSLRPRLSSVVTQQLGQKLRARVEVDDIVQETQLRALRSLGRFSEGGKDEFFSWLTGISRHVVLEAAKREKRDLIVPETTAAPDEGISQATAHRREERFDRLQSALDSLSPDHRQVILLARIERLPIKQVAEKMGRSAEAISQLLWRALGKLKGEFGETDSFHLPDRALKARPEDDGVSDGTR